MQITNTVVHGFDSALRGMRNPLESWSLSDSIILPNGEIQIGSNDLKLAQKLILAGSEHSKFMRMIQVWADFDMPRYYFSEFDTYHFNTKNSCSTMHKLLNNKKPITIELFTQCEEDIDILEIVVNRLELLRKEYLKTKNERLLTRAKRLLPEGFLQMRTINTNYAEIRNMYHQRKNHRLKEEWIDTFCTWVKELPYANDLILIGGSH
jgi:hypothetical protein